MALLWIEGFESLGTVVDAAPSPVGVVARKYSVTGEETRMQIGDGRISGKSLRLWGITSCHFQPTALTTNATMVVGVAVKFDTLNNTDQFLAFYDGTTLGMNLQLMSDGEVRVYRGTTQLNVTSGLGLTAGIWYHIEFKVLCDNAAGTYEMRVDGVNKVSGTGADTQAGSNAYHTTFRCLRKIGTASNTAWFDDLYCLDGSGTVNNDFLGSKKVVCIRPNAAGDSAQFTPSAGANWAAVDETICDDNTTYVEDAVSLEKDLYNYEAVVASGTISGVMVCTDCRETDASSFSLITLCKSGATESGNAGQAIGSTNYLTKQRILETNPNTSSAWTATAISAAQFGIKVA